MVTTQMKTDAQRLGNGKKAFDVKQVEKMIESAGGSYTAGTGIDITDDEISVDTTTIQEKLTAGTGIDITNNVISALGGESEAFTEFVYNSTERYSALYDLTNDVFLKDVFIQLGYAESVNGNALTCKGVKYYPKGTKLFDTYPDTFTMLTMTPYDNFTQNNGHLYAIIASIYLRKIFVGDANVVTGKETIIDLGTINNPSMNIVSNSHINWLYKTQSGAKYKFAIFCKN